MTPLLVALIAQAASQPATQPAAAGGGKASDVYAELTIIFEHDEQFLRAQESWRLRNDSGRTIDAPQLTVHTPRGAKRLRLEEGQSKGWKASEDATTISAEQGLAPGEGSISAMYLLPHQGDHATVTRAIPFRLGGVRVIMEKQGDLSISASVEPTRRERDLNGVKYLIWDFPDLPAGSTFGFELTGLPSRPTWPKWAALAAGALIILWTAWAAQSGAVPGKERVLVGPLSAEARRDRILRALEILERDKAAGKTQDAAYEKRRAQLLGELADVLREQQIARGTAAG